MSEVNSRKKASLISVIILFLLVMLVTIFVFKKLIIKDDVLNSDVLSLQATESSEYTASKKSEINSYITSLNEIYGINVIYGENSNSYATKVDASTINDSDIVLNNLKILFHTLEKYPPSMFDIFRKKDYKLDVILLGKFNNNNIALASKNNLNEIKLYISNNENFERAIHHELFHIFEYYMSDRNRTIFKDWSNLNPEGFVYNSNISNLNNKYVYLKEDGSDYENTYFVTKYAKTTEKEDRAETFAEIMMLQKKSDYLKSDTNIRKKADNLLEKMGEYFDIKKLYCYKMLN